MSKRIFIYDDVRNIKFALRQVGVTLSEVDFDNPESDIVHLVRPFRHNGMYVVSDHDNAQEVIVTNPRFDIWILDNDLAEGLEGFDFLKTMLADFPLKAPDKVLSCSANSSRKIAIESYFRDWLRVQNEEGEKNRETYLALWKAAREREGNES